MLQLAFLPYGPTNLWRDPSPLRCRSSSPFHPSHFPIFNEVVLPFQRQCCLKKERDEKGREKKSLEIWQEQFFPNNKIRTTHLFFILIYSPTHRLTERSVTQSWLCNSIVFLVNIFFRYFINHRKTNWSANLPNARRECRTSEVCRFILLLDRVHAGRTNETSTYGRPQTISLLAALQPSELLRFPTCDHR